MKCQFPDGEVRLLITFTFEQESVMMIFFWAVMNSNNWTLPTSFKMLVIGRTFCGFFKFKDHFRPFFHVPPSSVFSTFIPWERQIPTLSFDCRSSRWKQELTRKPLKSRFCLFVRPSWPKQQQLKYLFLCHWRIL